MKATLKHNLYYLDEESLKVLLRCECAYSTAHVCNACNVESDQEGDLAMTHMISSDQMLESQKDTPHEEVMLAERRKRHRLIPTNSNLLYELHRQLGHMSEHRIKLAVRNNLIKINGVTFDMIKDMKLPLCSDCLMG